ncbi:MAG: chorismate lyase [Gammaproteobacteria bacterium]
MVVKWSNFDNGMILPMRNTTHNTRRNTAQHKNRAATRDSTGRRYPLPQGALRALLNESASLTRHLSELLRQPITAEILEQKRVPLNKAWCQALHQRSSALWHQRSACLKSDSGPWVLAQTLLPSTALDQCNNRVVHDCGTQPIGNVLFTHAPTLQRRWIFCGQICVDSLPEYWQSLWRKSQRDHSQHGLSQHDHCCHRAWVRQSVLLTTPKPLAVTEIFLNRFCQHVQSA